MWLEKNKRYVSLGDVQKFICIKLSWPIHLEGVSISKKEVIVKLLQKSHLREETNLVALQTEFPFKWTLSQLPIMLKDYDLMERLCFK